MTPTLQLDVRLRNVHETDVPAFFQNQLDPVANHMAGFISGDPADNVAFSALWNRILTDSTFVKKTILFEGEVAGHIVKFHRFGRPEVTYWLGREYWGKGIATSALRAFLPFVAERPLYARVAKDNLASTRVLEKCGFLLDSMEKAFAQARGRKIQEAILIHY